MATFTIGKPIVTKVPSITVDAGLPVGKHRFQLEVVTEDQRVSPPDVAEVAVVEEGTRVPTERVTTRVTDAVVTPVRPPGGIVTPVDPTRVITPLRPPEE